jgi:hypothetical protein
MVEFFIENNADIKCVDVLGRTILHAASRRFNFMSDVVKKTSEFEDIEYDDDEHEKDEGMTTTRQFPMPKLDVLR